MIMTTPNIEILAEIDEELDKEDEEEENADISDVPEDDDVGIGLEEEG